MLCVGTLVAAATTFPGNASLVRALSLLHECVPPRQHSLAWLRRGSPDVEFILRVERVQRTAAEILGARVGGEPLTLLYKG